VAPGQGLRFLGWLPGADTYPFARIELDTTQGLAVPWGQITAAVAVFEQEWQYGEVAPSVVPAWWPRLFAGTACCARITSAGVFGYAKATEYARAMLDGTGKAASSVVYFLTIEEQQQAQRKGEVFRSDCRLNLPKLG